MARALFGCGGGEGDGDEFVPGDVRDGPGVVPAGETGPVGVVDRGAGAPLGPPDPDRSNRTFAPTRTAATSTSASTTGPNRSRGVSRPRPGTLGAFTTTDFPRPPATSRFPWRPPATGTPGGSARCHGWPQPPPVRSTGSATARTSSTSGSACSSGSS